MRISEDRRVSMGEYFNWVNVDKKEYLCPNEYCKNWMIKQCVFGRTPFRLVSGEFRKYIVLCFE